MKVCAIKHDGRKENFELFKAKLASAVKINPDLIIGPYDSLGRGLSSSEKKREIYRWLGDFSSKSDSLIIPGTISYPINEKEMVCESPVFHQGKLIHFFHKEKDNGEEDLAMQNGYGYKRGNNFKNKLDFKGKKIGVELCGDHGVQDTHGCDLELILAYDNRAGFWLSASNDDFKRKAIVCDGYAPKVEAFDYDPSRINRLQLAPCEVKDSFVIVSI
jgi:hypothetical protein